MRSFVYAASGSGRKLPWAIPYFVGEVRQLTERRIATAGRHAILFLLRPWRNNP
jgi:hypothetical protein